MYTKNRQDLSAEKTERRGRFYAKHTDSSPFQRFSVCGKIFINPCCSAGKETKKLLESVSTSTSREWLLVEPAGVEPASCNDLMTTYYTLVPFLLFRVLTVSQRTDFAQTASSEISHADR